MTEGPLESVSDFETHLRPPLAVVEQRILRLEAPELTLIPLGQAALQRFVFLVEYVRPDVMGS